MTTPSSPALARRFRRLDLAAVAAGDPAAVADRDALIRRGAVPDRTIRAAVRSILDDVRERREPAVREANARFGGGRHDGRLIVGPDELAAGAEALSPAVRRALEQAVANGRRFAETQRPATTRTTIAPGIEIERRWDPLASIGAYVPGGSAPYPSSLVMTVVPAQVAGVERIVVASPADADGATHPVLLGAAGLLGVDALVVAGGAQAIGALAYGLPGAGIEPVARIVGPGNAWVTAAKVEVHGEVGIDLPAGPSEGVVLAAPPARPARVALDLITQAEHGPDSPAILVTTSAAFADEVESEVEQLLAGAARRDILTRALRDHGRIVLAPNVHAAIAFVNAYAPEHLSIDVEPLEPTVARIRHAGSVFVGPWAPESAGDYATGANHVLPTGGLARSDGGLSVEAFGRYTQIQRVTREGLAGIRDTVATLAEAEGLLAAGRFETPLSEYPPSDYRRLVDAAAARYGVDRAELLVGAGADEILDLIAKAFLPAGGAAVIPTPTYAMYRVVTEQRAARAILVPRLGPEAGWGFDAAAIRAAVTTERARIVWLCSPNNPTALAEPDGAIAALLDGLRADAADDPGGAPPIVVLDEAYAEFAGRSLLDVRRTYPRLVVVRTASKAYALAGLRVGFAIAHADVVATINPFRPPGSVSTVSVTLVTEALLDPAILETNLTRVESERERLRAGLFAAGWPAGPSVTNFLLVDLGSAERSAAAAEGLMRRGLVPRTFPAGHPLAAFLRLTVRDRAEDDRLLEAVRMIEQERGA